MATILYDAEVFKFNWMFGFKILETNSYVQIWDDFAAMRRFIDDNKDSFFIGFNSKFYDDQILEAVLKKQNPYDVSCRLIDEGEKMYTRMKLHRMDIMEGMASGTSLKSIESELGMSIEETDVDFDIDRELTEEEIELTNKYNRHDLDATHQLLIHRWSNFVKTKMDLIKYFNLEPKMMQKPFATMVAAGLGAQRTRHAPRHFEWYDNLQIKNPEVVEFIREEKFLDQNLLFDLGGVEHKIGLGGMHGARESFHTDRFWKVDVKGYYSLIQMNLNLLSRSLPPEGKQRYKDLYFDRLERKKLKDPSADSLKAAVLAVWGATLNEYQLLSDITTGNLIMITGQAFMIDLIEKLEDKAVIIQTNTDGVFIEPEDDEACMEIINEWVTRTGFEVEIEKGTKLYQKDVNNYVCLINGDEIVAKGSYINLYKMQDDNKFFEFKLTYNQSQGTIMDKAVVNYFIHDIPVEETVNNETNPRSFMFTVKKGARTYSHVELHTYDKANDKTTIEKLGKVNRIFASKDPDFERHIYKIKNGTPNIFPRMDVNVFVFNKAMSEFTEEDMERIDRDYYIDGANKRIEDFTTLKKKKVKSVKENKVKIKVYPSEEDKTITEVDAEFLVEHVQNLPNGVARIGNAQVNRIGEWFTFVEKNGKTVVVSLDKLLPELFDLKPGKLNKIKVKVDKKQYFEVFERTFDTIVIYTDKADEAESFQFIASTYAEAIATLAGMGLIEDKVVKPVEEVKKASTGKAKETFKLDDTNHISYETYDMGQGVEYEVGWFREGKLLKKFDAIEASDALDKVEEWMLEFYDEVKE